MNIKTLHKWDLSYKKAVELQNQLAGRVESVSLAKSPSIVAGLDCSFTRDKQRIIAAVIVVKLPKFDIIETSHTTCKLNFPYIPGLLSFREAPACIAAVKKLKATPDLFLIDGQGIAHPRRLGLACHLGLFFDKPTIGCAKSRLTGSFEDPSISKGSYTYLKDKRETIGAVLRTRTNVKPLFVSIGTKCSLEDAIEFTLVCTTKYRLPEPTRLAHQLVTKLRMDS